MKFSNSVLLSIFSGLTSTANAACSYVNGNYYCSEVSAITYSGLGYSGSYSDVTNMDESTCQCTQQSVSFSGALSPLDEELSVHFRGPLKLLQFGVYYPSSSSQKVKREAENDCETTVHVHHKHRRAPAVEVVEVTATVYIDQHGNTVTTTGEATIETSSPAGLVSTTLDTSVTSSSSKATAAFGTQSTVSSSSTTSSSSTASSSSTKTSSTAAATSSSSSGSTSAWTRNSYFTPGSTDNTVFLNTLGDASKSGTWSSCFGNSISYCGSDGNSVVSSATPLGEVTIDSDVEYMIFSGQSCGASSSNGDCGYYREGIPAYHGFGGANKIFVFEFEMPTATDSVTNNHDMPAIWLLNAKIPRTLQYGDSSCSCWSTGCGEFDLFEILSSGSTNLISHVHDGQGANGSSQGGGGSSDYFARPTDSSMKAAVIFNNGEATIVILDDSVNFGSSLDAATVSSWLSVPGSAATLV